MWLSLVGYLGGYPYVHVVVSSPYYVVRTPYGVRVLHKFWINRFYLYWF